MYSDEDLELMKPFGGIQFFSALARELVKADKKASSCITGNISTSMMKDIRGEHRRAFILDSLKNTAESFNMRAEIVKMPKQRYHEVIVFSNNSTLIATRNPRSKTMFKSSVAQGHFNLFGEANEPYTVPPLNDEKYISLRNKTLILEYDLSELMGYSIITKLNLLLISSHEEVLYKIDLMTKESIEHEEYREFIFDDFDVKPKTCRQRKQA